MIHHGKTPQGELQLILTGEDVAHLHTMITGAGLEQRRVFHGLKSLIEDEFKEELIGSVRCRIAASIIYKNTKKQ